MSDSAKPIYLDGKPQNLEAAAFDALTWLLFWQKYTHQNHQGTRWDEGRYRLKMTIQMLEKYLPDRQPEFLQSPAFPEVDAVLEITSFSKDT